MISLCGLRSIAITDAGLLGCAPQNTYTFSAKGPSAVRLQPAEKKPRKFLFTISNTLEKGSKSHTTVYHLCCNDLWHSKYNASSWGHSHQTTEKWFWHCAHNCANKKLSQNVLGTSGKVQDIYGKISRTFTLQENMWNAVATLISHSFTHLGLDLLVWPTVNVWRPIFETPELWCQLVGSMKGRIKEALGGWGLK